MPSSKRQTAANQKNALVSTGPKTAVGKVRSSRNALQHGLRSSMVVLPDVEKVADWKAHLTAVVESLAPVGYVEEILTERVALLSWRLNRVARYERDAAALRLESVEADLSERRRWKLGAVDDNTHPADIRSELRWALEETTLFERLATAADDEALPDGGTAGSLVWTALQLVPGETGDGLEDFLPWLLDEDAPDGFIEATEWDGWTAGLLRQALAIIADRYGVPDLLERLDWELGHMVRSAEWRVKETEQELDAMRRERLLPAAHDLDKVTRYEAHLERGLYRALRELRDLQAQQGRPTAVVVIDHTQDPDDEEGS